MKIYTQTLPDKTKKEDIACAKLQTIGMGGSNKDFILPLLEYK